MRLMDVMLALPSLLLAIAVVAILGPGLANAMYAIAIVLLPHYVRLARAAVIGEAGKEYVASSRIAGAGTLRGRFQVEGLGEGRLYVEEGFAPYVLVRLRQGFVVVNFREPERTRALYDTMARAWPERVVTAAP